MSSEFLEAFIAEAKFYLDQIRYSLITYKDEGDFNQIKKAVDCLIKIKSAIPLAGLDYLTELLTAFHDDLEKISAETPTASSQIDVLLDKLKTIELALSTAEFPSEIVDLEAEGSTEKTMNESFEIDQEMLEIFLSEAEEHFQNIAINLDSLKRNSSDKEALSAIRRSFHTLKGSAGIMGFAHMSELAHRAEDLLDFLAQNPNKLDEKTFLLIQTTLNCLEVLSYGELSPQLEQKIAEIEDQISTIKRDLVTDEIITEDKVITGDKKEKIFISTQQTVQQTLTQETPRAVLRVSIERLNELARLASDVTVLYSFFENQLLKLKQQIEELKNNSMRFSRLTSKIETDFSSTERVGGFIYEPNLRRDFDTLELDRYTEFHQTSLELTETASDTSTITNELIKITSDLSLTFANQQKILREIRDKLLRLRMIPFATLEQRLQRATQVIAEEQNKKAELVIENGETEIDSEILHVVAEPILHLLRNAISHGIEAPEIRKSIGKPETGKIKVSVYNEETGVIFCVEDDGQGIDVEKLKKKAVEMNLISVEQTEKMSYEEAVNLIFISGVTTVSQLSEISGRGIGMEIVRACVERFKGMITVESERQKGTRFTLRLPIATSVMKVVPVKSGEHTVAFPIKSVRYVTEVSGEVFESARAKGELNIKGKLYKPVYLYEILGFAPSRPKEKEILILLFETPKDLFAVAVEQILKPEEIVVKPITGLKTQIKYLVGASILSDGKVMPILDLAKLIEDFEPHKPTVTKTAQKQVIVMIVDDSPSVRKVNERMISSIGWRAITAKDGLEALEILESSADELPDVILTDIEMPRMDGYELISTLRKRENLKQIPILIITSRTTEKHKQKAFELGATSYITKPFDQKTLVQKIKEVLR